MTNQAIGYIDSGVGGLTVVIEALKQLPQETVYYVGDTARMPYGSKTTKEVIEFTWQMVNFLLEKKIKMLVIACNTATAAVLPDLKKKLDIPVIGVINPGAKTATKITKNKKIGVIATKGTVDSNAYKINLMVKDNTLEITQLACPEFVQIVEKNKSDTKDAKMIIENKLSYFKDKNIDTLILGCTHFPLIENTISEVMGSDVSLVNSGKMAVTDVVESLNKLNIRNTKQIDRSKDEYYTTGDVKMFNTLAKHWLKNDHLNIKHLDITNTGLK